MSQEQIANNALLNLADIFDRIRRLQAELRDEEKKAESGAYNPYRLSSLRTQVFDLLAQAADTTNVALSRGRIRRREEDKVEQEPEARRRRLDYKEAVVVEDEDEDEEEEEEQDRKRAAEPGNSVALSSADALATPARPSIPFPRLAPPPPRPLSPILPAPIPPPRSIAPLSPLIPPPARYCVTCQWELKSEPRGQLECEACKLFQHDSDIDTVDPAIELKGQKECEGCGEMTQYKSWDNKPECRMCHAGYGKCWKCGDWTNYKRFYKERRGSLSGMQKFKCRRGCRGFVPN